MGRMFPHTVTVYNVVVEEDKEFHTTKTNYMTLLKGVLLDAVKAANVIASGIASADAVRLFIPLDVEAVDAVTGEKKSYASPMEFDAAKDKSGLWTMSLDGEGDSDSFFVKGVVVEPEATFQAISMAHDGVYNISSVDLKDFGRLQHWEVGGA